MDNDDIKLEDLIPLLDKCISSNRESTKRALKELLVIVALTETTESGKKRKIGPLESLLKDVGKLRLEVEKLRDDVAHLARTQKPDTTPPWGRYDDIWSVKDEAYREYIWKKMKGI